MDGQAVIDSIVASFPDAKVAHGFGATFFSCDPEGKYPFATVVPKDDDYDDMSDLDRPGVFRLSIGPGRERFLAIFGRDWEATVHDPTALDRLMPHPIYGRQWWISVNAPSAATFGDIQPLLIEAHAIAVRRQAGRTPPADAVDR
ncbi:MAG TPA: DUF6194 family protein [Candidatus Limnocylindrales bacterium]